MRKLSDAAFQFLCGVLEGVVVSAAHLIPRPGFQLMLPDDVAVDLSYGLFHGDGFPALKSVILDDRVHRLGLRHLLPEFGSAFRCVVQGDPAEAEIVDDLLLEPAAAAVRKKSGFRDGRLRLCDAVPPAVIGVGLHELFQLFLTGSFVPEFIAEEAVDLPELRMILGEEAVDGGFRHVGHVKTGTGGPGTLCECAEQRGRTGKDQREVDRDGALQPAGTPRQKGMRRPRDHFSLTSLTPELMVLKTLLMMLRIWV